MRVTTSPFSPHIHETALSQGGREALSSPKSAFYVPPSEAGSLRDKNVTLNHPGSISHALFSSRKPNL